MQLSSLASSKVFAPALFVAALAPRIAAALWWPGKPTWDGFYYDIGARSIAAGMGYSGETGAPWCHYPVGYSALIGGAYRVFGSTPLTATITNAVAGAALAVAVYGLARTGLGERRGRVAGMLVALYPGLIAYSALLMTEPVAAMALVGAALVASMSGRGATRAGIGAGVVLGLGALVRPQSLLCAPFLALFFPRATRWRGVVVCTLVALLTVAPWTVRNCMVMDGCALVSTNAGWNLAIGSFPRATGRFETLHGSDGCPVVTGQVQQDRCWLDHGLGWIAADPRRWLGLVPKKLGFTFDHESFPIGYLAEMDAERWPERDRAFGRGILSWLHRALLSAAALGVLARPRLDRPSTLLPPLGLAMLVWYAAVSHHHPFWLVALALVVCAAVRWRELEPASRFAAMVIGSLLVIHAVFFGEDRYHLVATPFLCVLAARVAAGQPPSAEVRKAQ